MKLYLRLNIGMVIVYLAVSYVLGMLMDVQSLTPLSYYRKIRLDALYVPYDSALMNKPPRHGDA